MPAAPTTSQILGDAASQYGMLGQTILGGVGTEGQIGQGRVGQADVTALGNIDAQAFLRQHPEFQEGWDNAIATGDDPMRWLPLAINAASYINPAEIPRSGGIAGTVQGLAGTASEIETAANTAARTAGVADVTKLAPALTDAYRGANKELFQTLGGAATLTSSGDPYDEFRGAVLGSQPTPGAAATGYNATMAAPVANVAATNIQPGALGQNLYGQAMSAGPSSVAQSLLGRANEFAQSTGKLTFDENRAVTQGTREAYAARGMEMSNPAIAAEIGNRIAAQRERQTQDLSMAGNLAGVYEQSLGASRGFAGNLFGQDIGIQQANQGAGLQAGLANQSMAGTLSLANQGAQNTAAQFTAGATNQAALFNAQLAAQQQQQRISNLGLLGDSKMSQLGADREYALGLAGSYQNAAFNPAAGILGTTSAAPGIASNMYATAAGANPDLSGNLGLATGVAQDTAMTKFNQEADAEQAAKNRRNALWAGAMGMIGGIIPG